ncbi:hypothetical protein AWB71_04542 [Caballeronia peredens]|nr:hypothetical protein AWB71_04542 [Caballeronia peredens]
MTRHIARIWIAGVICLVGGFASANEQARLLPLERAAAGMVFFPYPAVVSTAGIRSVRTVHARFSYGTGGKSTAVTSLSGAELGPRFEPENRRYPQALSPYSLQNPEKSRNDLASEGDEWHFQANPQLGVNHDREKGMTFLMRRGF